MLSFYSLTKPADFTECVGDELPVGWEQAYDYHRGGIYYVDHINSECQRVISRRRRDLYLVCVHSDRIFKGHKG